MEKQAVSNSFSSVEKLTEMLGVTKQELDTAIEIGYRRYPISKNDKIRYIEQPNDKLKLISQKLLIYLRENLECPPYCMAGYSKQNNVQNAKRHAKKREILVSDIIHFFLTQRLNTYDNFLKNILMHRVKY